MSQQSTTCRHRNPSSNIHPCAHCFVEEARRRTEVHTTATFTSEDGVCPICLNNYFIPSPDTKRAESPVRLECGHRIGYDCLLHWLLPPPEGGNGSTCVICKHQIIEARPPIQRRGDFEEHTSAQRQLEEARALSHNMLLRSVSYHRVIADAHSPRRMGAVREDPIQVQTKSPLSKLIKRLANESASLREETRRR